MRLRQVRLAGFKSFVDPTTIGFPGEIVGVVGPNGCGKSNIIDAVRWVMGEISAKHLRGDSMADVVFNGSTSRKPVSHAAVELTFDNSRGLLGGRWAAYEEISVKRQVHLDGQSSYFLNGTRCRRRDITDIFLGTGLGPRSYAIIEQGMITRLIEARPEELREFLEEAAGISKYKERRRETENRIRHTRENLERLNDLRDELEKRLEHLQRQAKAAEKYKLLKQEERTLRAQLLALRWRALDAECTRHEKGIREQETALEGAVAGQRRAEATLEARREAQNHAQERFNEVYRQVLDAGAEIARAEEAIRNLRLRREQLEEGLEREQSAAEEAHAHVAAEAGRLEALEHELQEQQPALDELQEDARRARSEFDRCDEHMAQVQAEWEELGERASEAAQQAQAERSRIQHLEDGLVRIRSRLARFEEEAAGLKPGDLAQDAGALESELHAHEGERRRLESALAERAEAIREVRKHIQERSAELDGMRERFQELRGRLASLQALQEQALGKQAGAAVAWLRAQSLDSLPRLAEVLEVEPGWERAMEAALGFHLESVCTPDIERLAESVSGMSGGAVTLFDSSPFSAADAPVSEAEGELLASRVRAPESVRTLLAGVHSAPDVRAALALRPRLGHGESVITPEGIWMGARWLRVAHESGDGPGVLAREHEIKTLGARTGELEQSIAGARDALAADRERLGSLEEEHADLQGELGNAHRHYAGLRSRLGARQVELEQARARVENIRAEMEELGGRAAADQRELAASRVRLQELADGMERLAVARNEVAERRQERRRELEQARERWETARDDAYQIGLRVESIRTQMDAIRAGGTRNREQVERLEARCAELREAVAGTEGPMAEASADLNGKLARRREREEELKRARRAVEEADAAVRETDHERHSAEAAVQAEREVVERLRMEYQEDRVRRQTLEESLAETGHQPATLLGDLAAEADPGEWEQRLEHIDRRIARLGPINLAAIEEFDEQSQRKQYLDSQYQDLTEALDTLQEAIHKIDRETRARFKETYEKVNDGLGAMFPRLFGGGRAYLQMTGEDLLSTGIALMAQPPGKRNSTIHLLSGGEKALTAVALVFAIFELNPAPFCLLDEVDAPLDDANVGRFCDLVRDMSERVQFILVTHNKTTMEMAQQLIGVTMNEPGVSRLVAVDVDEAVELAAV